MLVDIVPLPVHYCEYDNILDTTLPRFSYINMLDDITCYGRAIPLDIFTSGQLHKYKTVELFGEDTIERIFISEEPIDFTKKWWTSKDKVYPIQRKCFSYRDPIVGNTFKYVNGITQLLEKYVEDDIVIPVALKNACVKDPDITLRSPYNIIIPSLETDLFSGDWRFTPIPTDGIDHWADMNLNWSDIGKYRGVDFSTHIGNYILGQIQRPFDDSTFDTNTNPINKSWKLYELLMMLNDLAVSDIRLDITPTDVSVAFSSRYTGYFDYSQFPGYNAIVEKLTHKARDMVSDRYREDPWRRIVIEKLWSEEIYMTMYVECEYRSSLIDTCSYIDLPIFLLGTVGLY